MSAPTATDTAARSRLPRPAGTTSALLVGAAATLAATVGIAMATGLGLVFAAVALGTYAGVAAVVSCRIAPYHPAGHFGLPNAVTLGRTVATALVCGYAVALAAGDTVSDRAAAAFAGLAALAILVDGIDGFLARRIGPATAFGARFDMEIDALLLAALSLVALALGKAGVFVLAIGLMRYAFVAAMILAPWLGGPLPASFRRKAVCVVQGAVLVALAAPAIGPALGGPLALSALVALAWSFGADIRHLAACRRTAR